MSLRSFVAVVCAGAFVGSAFGAGGPGTGFGSGIADVRADRSAARKLKSGTSDRERGGVVTTTDEGRSAGGTSGNPLPVTACDFVGFPQNDPVNGAYGGGTSGSGVSRTNLGLNFSGLAVLNTFNGTNPPNPSIAYSASGVVVMSSSTGSFWRDMTFHYSSSVPLTAEAFSGTNATGTLVQTFSIAPNLSGAPFITWTQRQLQFSTGAKSVRLTGEGNYWGIDALSVTAGCPAPASASDDCNGNGQSDACEIAFGQVQDCNGNGRPDTCDIGGNSVTRTASMFSHGSWAYAYTESGITFTSGQDHVHLDYGFIWNHSSCCTTPIWITAAEPTFTLKSLYVGYLSGSNYRALIGSNGAVVNITAVGTMNFGETFRNVSWVRWDEGNAYDNQWTESWIDDVTIEVGTPGLPDCNGNGVPDSCDIAGGAVADCNGNGVPDSCDIAGGMADCNANGAIDSCELASGSAVDQNGNGIPDTCDPTPTLVLTANAAACNAVGSEVDMEARLSGVLNLVVAGQLVLDWDPSKLELVSSNAGDAPYVTSYLVNNASGQAVILVSAAPGGSGTTSQSAIVSRLRFRVLGGSCDGSGTSVGFGSFADMLTTTFTDGFGGSVAPTLVSSSGFVVDDGAPVLSNVPADVSVQAFAGEGGYAFATLGTPTATDACAPSLTATGVRSDGQALGAAWPSGTTTVTWSATDPCGNTTTATTSVTVDPTNTLDLAAQWGGGHAGATRSLSLSILGTSGLQARTVSVSILAGGSSSFSVTDLPVDTYSCATIEDPARSLRARIDVSDTGSAWSGASATMVLGDLINDEVIDVLDWGAYIVRNANADFNGDGLLNSLDGDVILANFGRKGDTACTSSLMGPREALTEVSVADLVSMGMPELAGADLNGDGMLDAADMDLARN